MSGKGARDSAAPVGCSQRHGCPSGCFSSCSCIFCRPELSQSSIELACAYRVSESLPSWAHLDAPVSTSPVIEEAQAQAPQTPEASSSDPRIDQLVDAEQLIINHLENLNGTVSPTRRVEDDPSDEAMTERKIVDSRALLHLT